jgi:hypothetical protein
VSRPRCSLDRILNGHFNTVTLAFVQQDEALHVFKHRFQVLSLDSGVVPV